ncbi:MAG: extracellular solute-binding protein, partial [Symploca sp. SIO2E9]|nr:extracellular solute-binding protein [Symploca sp. SIO2E9]
DRWVGSSTPIADTTNPHSDNNKMTLTDLSGFCPINPGSRVSQPEGNDTAQIRAVAEAQCDLAIVNSYYVARLKLSDKPEDQEVASKIEAFFPNQKEGEGGTHVNISGGGVVATAPNQENAIKFLEYLVTPEAQEIFANSNNEFPAVEDVKANAVVAEFGNFQESKLKVAAYGEKNAEAVKLMDRAGWK